MLRIKPKVYFKHGMWWMLHGAWSVLNGLAKGWVRQMNMRDLMREKQKLSDWENAQHWLRQNVPMSPKASTYALVENAIRQAKQPGPWEQRMVMGNCS